MLCTYVMMRNKKKIYFSSFLFNYRMNRINQINSNNASTIDASIGSTIRRRLFAIKD